MKKEVNVVGIIGIGLLVILLIVAALVLTRCNGEVPEPTEPSITETEETHPTETEEPTEPPHVHEYEETVTKPDCISGGYTTFVCACGDSYVGNDTDALGHDWKDATCTDPKTCAACGVTEGRANGHKWDEGTVTVPAEESKEGEKLFTCTVCKATKTQAIPTLDHVHNYEETVEITPPTCTEDGYTTHTCRCGDSKVDSEVKAPGHTMSEATCTKPEVCSVCGTTGKAALGHKWNPATCTEPMTCGVCSEKTGVPKGHKETTVKGHDATCTETGLTDGIQCSVCKTWIKEKEVIPAKGHKEKTVKGKDPTCTETGLTDGIQCSVCNVWIKEKDVIPAKGHSEEIIKGYDSTCTETGLTDGVQCSVCKTWIKEQDVIPAKGHKEKTVKGKDPTCTETGLTDGIQCSVCNVWIKEQEVIPAKGHSEEIIKGYDSTCTATGLTDGKKCSVCGVTTVAPQPIPKNPHTEVTVTGKAATCTATGLTDGKKCSVCGTVTLKQETIPALGHSYGNWETTKQATCGAEGSQKRVCSRCTSYETKAIPATGNHTYEWGLCKVCGHDTLLKSHDFSFDTFNVDNTITGAQGYYITLSDIFDLASLKNRNFTMHVSMRFTLTDVDAGSDGEYIFGFRLYNHDTDTQNKLWDYGTSSVSKGSHYKTFNNIVNINANNLKNDCLGFLFVEDTWSLFGVKTNEYQVSGLVMTVTFTQ